MRLTALLAPLTLLMTQAAGAQTGGPALPRIVTDALVAFQAQGVEAGVKALTPNWVGTEDEPKQQQLIDGFAAIQEIAGPLVGYDLVRRFEVSPHLTRAYIVLLYKRMPAYLLLHIYSAPGEEVAITTVDVHTIASKVFPAILLEPSTPAQE